MAEIKFSTGSGNNDMQIDGKKAGRTAVIIVILAAIGIFVFNCFTIVETGFVGVKYRFGEVVNANLGAGLNFKIPFVEEIRLVDTRNQIYEFSGDAYTSDNQTVNDLRIKVTYRYNTAHLGAIVKDIGIANVESRFIVPSTQNSSRNEIGQVRAEDLVQQRSVVRDKIRESLQRALEPHGIIVTEVAIENIAFTPDFEAAIQNKVIAEQRAFEAVNKTAQVKEEAIQAQERAKGIANAVIAEAEGQAQAIKLIQEQLAASPSYIEYLKIIEWNGVLPMVIGDGVNPFVVLDGQQNRNTPAQVYTPPANLD